MVKTLYFNIEDDLRKVVARLKREEASQVVLVFPKQSYLFSDGVNLKMLKKQTDVLGKNVAILTMDERGQVYAKDAGFELRQLPKGGPSGRMGDIKISKSDVSQVIAHEEEVAQNSVIVKDNSPHNPKKNVKKVVKRAIPRVQIKDAIFPDLSGTENSFRSARSFTFKKWLVSGVALLLVLVVLMVTVILPKASITIYARSEPVARDVELALSTQVTSPDSTQLNLPATPVDKTLELEEKFTSKGKQEIGAKAQGRVRIFNLAKLPLNLKADTTTLTYTKTNKNYIFTADVNSIKPVTQAQVSDPAAGRVTDIIATEGGEEFNLPGGTRLEIANQVFGSKPQFLYAVTEGEITGGNSRFLSVISSDDITEAQKNLSEKLVKQVQEDLQKQGSVLPDKAFVVETLSFTTDKVVNTPSPTFTARLSARVRGLAFKSQMLSTLLRDRISQLLPPNKHLQDKSGDSITYQLKTIDIANGTALLSAHFESKSIFTIDTSGLALSITSKNKEQATEILLSKPEINRVEIVLYPSWQNTLPRLVGKIKIEEHE